MAFSRHTSKQDGSSFIMPDNENEARPPRAPGTPSSRSPIARTVMYCTALLAGVALVITGHATPVEASGYVSPFLVVFQEIAGKQ